MKGVKFNLESNKIFTTYSIDEYDRLPIDSILYLKCYNKITDDEWNKVLVELNDYKTREMVVHNLSICNTKLHT
jgi:hypothetical protein